MLTITQSSTSGSATTSASPTASAQPPSTTRAPVIVELTFNADYNTLIASEEARSAFIVTVSNRISELLGIPTSMFTITSIRAGSIIVTIAFNEPTAASSLTDVVSRGAFTVSFAGVDLVGTTETTDDTADSVSTSVIVGSVFGAVIGLVIIILVVAFVYKRHSARRLYPAGYNTTSYRESRVSLGTRVGPAPSSEPRMSRASSSSRVIKVVAPSSGPFVSRNATISDV